ncbi:MAG TPA: C4-dicarboxylic acid transporter DauA [Planctomycetota bacterium]|nr:C4-dicarboxylic acid transporter DauA [Planctomycetota bacterium]
MQAERYDSVVIPQRRKAFPFATALRETFAQGYAAKNLAQDLMAGIIVGLVALPLSIGLAIATEVPPQHGIYTAIIGGALAAALGGSRVSVTGPTAAFIVILLPIVGKFGLGGLLVAGFMAGLMLLAAGAFRLGKLIEYIPHPVTTGFTCGIAVVIATTQVPSFFGLSSVPKTEPDADYFTRVGAIARGFASFHLNDFLVGGATLALLLLWPRVTRKVPAPLVALSAVGIGAFLLHRLFPGSFEVVTIQSKYFYTALDGSRQPGIPPYPPLPHLPWAFARPGEAATTLDLKMIGELVMPAFTIAMLGAIESLLCAVVADGMAQTKHDPDAELVAQGLANMVVPFFGGIAATGAIARSATGIRAGARSPISSITHALFVLAGCLALAPVLGYLPMASIAALLILVAYNMSEVRHFTHIVRVAPKSDVLVLLACFSLTVVFDMVKGVSVGVVLAALLFMKRMAELSQARLTDEHPHAKEPLPAGVSVYEIRGPLFFGAAEKAVATLRTVAGTDRTIILDMSSVPVMDVTGLVALESAVSTIERGGGSVILAGVQKQPAQVFSKARFASHDRNVTICETFHEAVELSKKARDQRGKPADEAAELVAPASIGSDTTR